MDIQKIISDIVSKIGGDNEMIGSFLSDPLKAVSDLLHIDVNADQISEIVSGVTKMLVGQDGKTLEKNLMDKVKGLLNQNQ